MSGTTPEEDRLVLYVVDDERATLEELSRILRRQEDFEVVPSASPEEALKEAGDRPPDLALLDLRLPGMSGLQLLERLLVSRPDLMAIVMTGYGEAETARRARETGALDFVEKPLDLSYLLVVLRQLAREYRLRRTLRTSADLFRRVLDLMPDGIVMTDAAGKMLFANTLGRALADAEGPEEGTRAQRDGRIYELQRHAAGQRVLLHWMDLTAALDRERLAAHKQMARFLAHEIRNPLTPMRLWLQELDALDPADPHFASTAAKAATVLRGQVDRLMELVNRFQTLGSDLPSRTGEVGLMALLHEAVTTLEPLAASRGVRIEIPRAPVRTVKADEASLYQILFNLLRNAVEAFSGASGTVRVEVEEEEGWTCIRVEDDAGGLPAEVAASPFTPYLSTKPGGTGLGLVLCRDLAQRLGGTLDLHNRPGRGLAVTLTLRSA
ncbi:MAG: hybrid sensor histidine kinase/response regulator [Acidobacteriota bacterium]